MLKWLAPLPGLLWFLIIYATGDQLAAVFKEELVAVALHCGAVLLYYASFTEIFQTLITMPGYARFQMVSSSGPEEDACIVIMARLGLLLFIYGLPIMLMMSGGEA